MMWVVVVRAAVVDVGCGGVPSSRRRSVVCSSWWCRCLLCVQQVMVWVIVVCPEASNVATSQQSPSEREEGCDHNHFVSNPATIQPAVGDPLPSSHGCQAPREGQLWKAGVLRIIPRKRGGKNKGTVNSRDRRVSRARELMARTKAQAMAKAEAPAKARTKIQRKPRSSCG